MANYRYVGNADLVYEDANDEYNLVMVLGDRFSMYRHGQVYVVHHESDSKITFKLTLKEGRALERASEETLSVMPDPDNPPYMMFQPKYEMVPLLYDYFNRTYFNNVCPVVKFRKSTNASIWGMAELNWVRGKPVYTFHINESSMIDRVLFTNTILHEMIHLFNYAKGAAMLGLDAKKGMEFIHANHGPLFVTEMNRLNGQGFHITKEGTHEEFKRNATEEFHVIIARALAGRTVTQWAAWYTQNQFKREDLDRLCASLKEQWPTAEFDLRMGTTTDRKLTSGTTHVKGTNTFTAASLKKFFKGDVNTSEVHVNDTAHILPSTNVILPEFKEMPENYAMPFNMFCRAMRTYTSDHMVLKAKWMKMPMRMLNLQVQYKFQTLVGRMARGSIPDADIVNNLNDIRMSYDERVSHADYRKIMAGFIKEFDRKGQLAPYAKIMQLVV